MKYCDIFIKILKSKQTQPKPTKANNERLGECYFKKTLSMYYRYKNH